jgi:hypothetical protein
LSYHLTEVQMTQLFEQVRSMMHSTSVFLMDIIDPEMDIDPEAVWRGFPYYVRPFAFYEAMAQRVALSVQRQGSIRDYGYPEKINLSANRLLEFRRLALPPVRAA